MPVLTKQRNPLRVDPTRTGFLRRLFIGDINRRFKWLKRQIRQLIVVEDAFGLRPKNQGVFSNVQYSSWGSNRFGLDFGSGDFDIEDKEMVGLRYTVNTRWRFLPDDQKVAQFNSWLTTQVNDGILGAVDQAVPGTPWTARYIRPAYEKGVGRAFDQARLPRVLPRMEGSVKDFFAGTRTEFLRQSFGDGVAINRVKLLQTRSFNDLKGITGAMSTQVSRELTDGLIQGLNPNVIARNITERVDKIGITRARTLARTEIIRAHAEGQLDSFEKMGVVEVGVMAEWSTAGDDRVCPQCQPMDGVVFTIQEARGLIPLHGNCRCMHIPANIGEKRIQIRGKRNIETAIRKSIKGGVRKSAKKLSARLQRKLSNSPLTGVHVSKNRPKSIFDKDFKVEKPIVSRGGAAPIVPKKIQPKLAPSTGAGGGVKPKAPTPKPKPKPKAKVETKKPEFTPANTIDEAEDWARSKGIEPHWQRTDGKIPEFVNEAGENIERFKLSLDQINTVQKELNTLLPQYPKAKIDAIGSMYDMDSNVWRGNFERNIAIDKANFKGKRWRQVDAEKRVRKQMVSEPTINRNIDGEYSIFHVGEFGTNVVIAPGKSGRALRINHKQVVTQTKALSDSNRASTLARKAAGKERGITLSNIGDDLESLSQHEFGHVIDDAYGLRTDKKLVDLFGSLSEAEITDGLSSYGATSVEEFIAEGFTEGLRLDARPLGKKIKELIDNVVKTSQ